MVAEMSLLTRMFDFMSQQPSGKEIVDIKATIEILRLNKDIRVEGRFVLISQEIMDSD